MLLPGTGSETERKKKKSCNKNAIKNTEMLEKYIYITFQSKKIFF